MKTIFLGYPFAIPEIHHAVIEACDGFAQVLIASERWRGQHLLQKIDDMIMDADLSLFDLTLHNPNVAVEFGLAYARGVKWGLMYSLDEQYKVPKQNASRIFSDLEGMDSVRYLSFDELKRQLRDRQPEFLEAPHDRVPRVTSQAYWAPTLAPEPRHDAALRPRLYADIKPIYGPAFATNRSPVTKLGPDTMSVTLSNDGNGPANTVTTSITGFTFTDHVETIGPRQKVTRKWPLEDQPAYATAPSECIITVRYKDDNGDSYEQTGTLEGRQSGRVNYYSGSGLGPPRKL